jgi:diguanylate cyclase (GGDEF)-like protein
LCAAAQLVTGAAFTVLFEPHLDGTLVATAGTDGVNVGLRVDPRTHTCGAAQVWHTRTRIYLADAAVDSHSSKLAEHTKARALLCQPVTRRGCATAVLVVGFSESHRHAPASALYLVELLAAEIGAAIDRADMVALLAAQSRRDSLTGAANRRSWDEEMNREMARAYRSGAPLAVVIIDIDHFKAYNDTHGHTAGDELLKDLVTAIRAELRAGDLIARWGGEEFALALHDCDLQEAQTIASRLLNVVPGGQIVSIGLTQARAQDTLQALFERADMAFYTAKNGGRNQVKAYQSSPPPALFHGHGVCDSAGHVAPVNGPPASTALLAGDRPGCGTLGGTAPRCSSLVLMLETILPMVNRSSGCTFGWICSRKRISTRCTPAQ